MQLYICSSAVSVSRCKSFLVSTLTSLMHCMSSSLQALPKVFELWSTQGIITECFFFRVNYVFLGCEKKQRYNGRHISETRMSEGRSRGVAPRFSGGRPAVCHATPPAPLTRSGSDQNTTSRSSNPAGEGASSIKLSGSEGSDTLSDQDVTSGQAGRSSSWQVVTREKKSPGELTGSVLGGE